MNFSHCAAEGEFIFVMLAALGRRYRLHRNPRLGLSIAISEGGSRAQLPLPPYGFLTEGWLALAVLTTSPTTRTHLRLYIMVMRRSV